jgi:hypothetical protein
MGGHGGSVRGCEFPDNDAGAVVEFLLLRNQGLETGQASDTDYENRKRNDF